MAKANAHGTTVVVGGVTVNRKCAPLGLGCEVAEAVAAAQAADVVVLCLGTTSQNDPGRTNGEGQDRPDIALPGSQTMLADAVFAAAHAAGTPVVLVLVNGGIVAIDDYVARAAAIVEAFFPSLQSPVLARTLFGQLNRWGKLPVTQYATTGTTP